MKILIPLIFILILSVAVSAEVQTISGGEGIVITPTRVVDKTIVFLDGEMVQTFDGLSAGKPTTIEAEVGDHVVEVRSLVTFSYTWNNFKVTANDEPLALDYAGYVKNDNMINMGFKGGIIVHPDDLNTTNTSKAKKLSTYTVLLNGQSELNCYPKLTTGKIISFNCFTSSYPQTMDITITAGVVERKNVTVEKVELPEVPAPPPPPVVKNESNLPDEEVIPPPPVIEDEQNESIVLEPESQQGTAFLVVLVLILAIVLIVGGAHFLKKRKPTK